MNFPFPFLLTAVLIFGTSIHRLAAQEAKPAVPSSLSAAQGLALLKEGNRHFVANKLNHPHQTGARRTELAANQHPFAVILGCADSRTSPGAIFDQGLGDLFEIRIAGNLLTREVLGSIEFAVLELGAPLIIVLGHERCGAIKAARDTLAAKAAAPGSIQSLVESLTPSVESTKGKDADSTARTNVRNVTEALQKSQPILKKKIAEGKLTILGSFYDLDTGEVQFFEEIAVK